MCGALGLGFQATPPHPTPRLRSRAHHATHRHTRTSEQHAVPRAAAPVRTLHARALSCTPGKVRDENIREQLEDLGELITGEKSPTKVSIRCNPQPL